MSGSHKRSTRRTLAVLLAAFATLAHPAEVDERKAAQVMAAYLRHIAALTTWPDPPSTEAKQPILIGLVGSDPNGVMSPIRERMHTTDQLMAQGRPVRVQDLAVESKAALEKALEPCELVFFSEGSRESWERIRPRVANMPIVTVSEMAGFAEGGGMIEYLVDLNTGKVRLIINLAAMRQAGITLSARLLALESVIVLGQREEA